MALFDEFTTFLAGRTAWYKLPELIVGVFALGSAFAVLILSAIANHWPRQE